MSTRNALAAGALATALLACSSPGRALALPGCPPSVMNLGGTGEFSSTESRLDSTLTIPGYGGAFRVAYDLAAGSVSMYHCCSLTPTIVTASDLYDVAGVPPGTPVDLTVEFEVDGLVWTDGCGGSGCGGVFTATLRHGAAIDERVHAIHLFSGSEATHDVLQLPLTVVAGQPERIDFSLSGHRSPGGSHGSSGTGVFRFVGTTPGVTVFSCQGYSTGVVAARRRSWGQLKSIYR